MLVGPLRLEALNLAVRVDLAAGANDRPDETVERAETFLAFLQGDVATENETVDRTRTPEARAHKVKKLAEAQVAAMEAGKNHADVAYRAYKNEANQ